MKQAKTKVKISKKAVVTALTSVFAFLFILFAGFSDINFAFPYKGVDELALYVLIDQFGYRPGDRKVAVLVQSRNSTNNSNNHARPAYFSDLYQVTSLDTGSLIYEAPAIVWRNNEIHSQSGDRAAWFDFTQVQESGKYVIKNARTGLTSAVFEISDDVYQDVLIAATRMYFYQRSGFAKQPPYVDRRWTDNAAFLGTGQDTEARFINDKDNIELERDMSGGWFDAGDTNKYVTFAAQSVHDLLNAYTQNPKIWTDNFNIPESGNGIPDLLDELKFELDWLQRMQDDDGGAFIKIGTLDFNYAARPSLDLRPRFYGPKCSSSTIATAGMFAHAAWVFQNTPALSNYSEVLQEKAITAWSWFNSHARQTNCDTQEIKSGDADNSVNEQIGLAVNAAVYLFALTKDPEYNVYINENFQDTRPFKEFGWAVYEPYVGDALLAYTQLNGAAPEVKRKIVNSFTSSVKLLLEKQSDLENLDPYRAYIPDAQYHWGSNSVKSNFGNVMHDAMVYGVGEDSFENQEISPLDMLHYLHGVNPFGMVYLTNMYDYGVRSSANEMYHEWFGKGLYDNALTSPNGPAPGYLTGGPNKHYTGSAPLAERPPMRAYADSNKGGDLRMWEITEPSIAYQSSYIKLLSKFVSESVN